LLVALSLKFATKVSMAPTDDSGWVMSGVFLTGYSGQEGGSLHDPASRATLVRLRRAALLERVRSARLFEGDWSRTELPIARLVNFLTSTGEPVIVYVMTTPWAGREDIGLRHGGSVTGKWRTFASLDSLVQTAPNGSLIVLDAVLGPGCRQIIEHICDRHECAVVCHVVDGATPNRPTRDGISLLGWVTEVVLRAGSECCPDLSARDYLAMIHAVANTDPSIASSVQVFGGEFARGRIWTGGGWSEIVLRDDRILSTSKGSREDSLQELLVQSRDHNARIRDQAIFQVVYMAALDSADTVRRAAALVLAPERERAVALDIGKASIDNPHADKDWIPVPAGIYSIGTDPSDAESRPEEQPRHGVWIDGFSVLRTPVLVWQFQLFAGATGLPWVPYSEEPESAASNLDWHEALAYCDWLTAHMRRRGLITGDHHVTLPSEAEWEAAAGGPDGLRYPWGNDWVPGVCNVLSLGVGKPTTPGQFSPSGDSPFGCADMSGNVWEWTRTLWGSSSHYPDFRYPYDPTDGREDIVAGAGMRRVVRGGSYYYFDNCVRVATRNYFFPTIRHSGGGFRPVIRSEALTKVSRATP
jgi:formylglycine-generating enzyme required for sulfatase activity